MVCCLYKRVDYGTLKGHWFLKSNLKTKSTIQHIKSITKRVLSVFIIFIKYFSFTNFEGLVVKYAPSFPPARARSSNFFICLLQERIKLYPLKLAWSHQFFKDLGWWSIRGLNLRRTSWQGGGCQVATLLCGKDEVDHFPETSCTY